MAVFDTNGPWLEAIRERLSEIRNWGQIYGELAIAFEGRMP